DFHTPQKIAGTTAAYYVGAPFDLKFGQECDRQFMTLEIDDGDLDIVTEANMFNFPMRSYTPEEFINLNLDSEESFRHIIRLTEAPTPDERVIIDKMKESFYSVYVPKIKIDNQNVEEDTEDVLILSRDLSEIDDTKIIKDELESLSVGESVKKKAVKIF